MESPSAAIIGTLGIATVVLMLLFVGTDYADSYHRHIDQQRSIAASVARYQALPECDWRSDDIMRECRP